VRAYHGKRKLPKTHVARIRLAMPATTDYWVNDQSGEPLFVLTAPANAGLVKMLSPILDEVRRLVGERRVTIVFDRGGWSPKLFRKIVSTYKFDILTYRKGKRRRINEKRFEHRRAKLDGRWVHYRLHDQAVRFLKGKLRLRQVTRLGDDGHQTQVLTSRWDLRDVEVAYRMFERWRQENFFKYMREEFLIDALVDYRIDTDDPTRTVPNPERRVLDKEVRAARAEVAKIEKDYGAAALDNPENRRPTMRGFKIANAELGARAAGTVDRGAVERRASFAAIVPIEAHRHRRAQSAAGGRSDTRQELRGAFDAPAVEGDRHAAEHAVGAGQGDLPAPALRHRLPDLGAGAGRVSTARGDDAAQQREIVARHLSLARKSRSRIASAPSRSPRRMRTVASIPPAAPPNTPPPLRSPMLVTCTNACS
jgi:hypothetical protein